MARAYIGLGANLGEPALQLRAALERIADLAGVELIATSTLYRSAPLGIPGQPDYCNAACAVETTLAPLTLMRALIGIERAAGRLRDGRKWGPRLLDLDLLAYDDVALDTPELRLPHPEIGRRNFVLVPLAEIAPQLHIAGIGSVTEAAQRIGRAGLEPWPD